MQEKKDIYEDEMKRRIHKLLNKGFTEEDIGEIFIRSLAETLTEKKYHDRIEAVKNKQKSNNIIGINDEN